MLQQQNHRDENSDPGKMRVKAEEFAKAIAAIDARNQEEAKQREGTLLITEAVQDLELDISADEILREILVQRGNNGQEESYAQDSQSQRIRHPAIKWILSGCVLITFLCWISYSLHENALRNLYTSSPTPFYQPSFFPRHSSYGGTGLFSTDPPGFGQKTAVYYKVNSISEGKPFLLNPFTAMSFLRGYSSPSQINSAIENLHLRGGMWEFIRLGNSYYLHGWINAIPHAELSPKQVWVIYQENHIAGDPVNLMPVNIRINTLKNIEMWGSPTNFPLSRNQGESLITASDIVLDQHAWDK
jgi:hypothetical protein